MPLSLQHQTKCLQTINNSIQQFNQHLKAEKLDRQILQLIVLQLQNDFAILRYLLFSSAETLPSKDITVKNSATSPLLNSTAKPNPNPNPTPTSSALPLPGPGAPKLHRSTPVGAVGPPRIKINNTTNADLQLTTNKQETPSTTEQNLTSRICKLEKLFANEVSTYTSITAGIHSQYFFLYDKIRQLESGNSDVIIWKIPSVKFVFDSAKLARPSSDPLLNRPRVLVVLSSGLTPTGTTSSSNSIPMVLDPLQASVLQFYSPSSLEITILFSNGPSQRLSTLGFEINWTQ